MKVDFNKNLLDIRNKEIKEGEKTATLKEACVNSLLNLLSNESLEGPKKFQFWKLAKCIEESVGEIELSVEDIAIIKERVGKLYFPSIVGSVYSLLEKN